ncbi:MAG: hypothetical protein ACRC63_00230, partial [Metamycoplasmataceae bacterium]
EQNADNDFMIGIDTDYPLPIPPSASEESEIQIEISASKFSDRINGKYKIKIKELINYGPNVIDFNAIKPPLSILKNNPIRRVMKWK